MYTTYGKVRRGDIIDGHAISWIDRWCAEDVEMTRLHTEDGGNRTQCSDYPVMVQHHADPKLVDVSDEDLAAGVDYFAAWLDLGEADNYPALMTGLHGLALELNRRRALACIASSCACRGNGH